MKNILSLIMGLILCLLIIWLAYKGCRLLAQKAMGGRYHNRYLREIDRIALGQEEFVSIVRCGDRHFLIGATRQNISCLADLGDEDSLTELPEELSQSEPALDSEFMKLLKEKAGDIGGKVGERVNEIKNRRQEK